MIWQSNCHIIVMLTNVVENMSNKCSQYWPDAGTKTYENIEATTTECHSFLNFSIRKFNVRNKVTSEERTVCQFHFTDWQDHKVPEVDAMLSFLHRVDKYNTSIGVQHPLLVHCSAGVGRTGTFIALASLLNQARAEGKVDILGIVHQMRAQRTNMVYTVDQYAFLYEALLGSIIYDEVCVPVGNFMETYGRWTSAQSDTKYSIQNQFQSYIRKYAYLIVPIPVSDSKSEFWRMVHEHKVTLIIELQKPSEPYIPVVAEHSECDGLLLSTKSISMLDTNVAETIVEELHQQTGETRTVQVLQTKAWEESKTLPETEEVLLSLCKRLEQWDNTNSQVNQSPVLVLCRDGVTCCGLFCLLTRVMQRIQHDDEVDVFHATQSLKQVNPKFISSFEQYIYCYDAVAKYLDNNLRL